MKKQNRGFSLIEMAVVLMIVGLLLGGMLVPLSAQIDQRNVSDTQKTLSEIKQALIGYAITYGRLPCPASSTSNGTESFAFGGVASNGNCLNFPSFYNGFVPAATLGLTPLDSQGYVIDAWGYRIHYAVTSANSYAFTKTGGIITGGLSALAPNLLVCASATGITATSCGAASNALTSTGVPVVIYSIGKNGGSGGTSPDEIANPNPNSADNDRVFVSHPPTSTFDDLVDWISPNILYNRMVAAGNLP